MHHETVPGLAVIHRMLQYCPEEQELRWCSNMQGSAEYGFLLINVFVDFSHTHKITSSASENFA
jgi:hypothetical protein